MGLPLDHKEQLTTEDEEKNAPKDSEKQENTSSKPVEFNKFTNPRKTTGAKRESVTGGGGHIEVTSGTPREDTIVGDGLNTGASNTESESPTEDMMSLKDIQWDLGGEKVETVERSEDSTQGTVNDHEFPYPPSSSSSPPLPHGIDVNVLIAENGKVPDSHTSMERQSSMNGSIEVHSFDSDTAKPSGGLGFEGGEDRLTIADGEVSKEERDAWKRIEEEAGVERSPLEASKSTEETRDKKAEKKSPRKRKVTMFKDPVARRGSRFSVEQVSEAAASQPAASRSLATSTLSSSSIGTEPSESQFQIGAGETNFSDADNEDDVFGEGFDNLGFHLGDNDHEPDSPADDDDDDGDDGDDDGDDDDGPEMRRSNSHPSMHHFHEKYQPEMRRCESTIDQDVHSVIARKDSVVVMKKKFDKRPKLLKYDESIEQWVKHHMGHEPLLPRPPRPDDHLPLSCIVLFCCCNVAFGLAALIFSLKSNKNYEKGDYDEARRTSRISLIVSIVGVIVTLVFVVVLLYVYWPETSVRQIN